MEKRSVDELIGLVDELGAENESLRKEVARLRAELEKVTMRLIDICAEYNI